MQEFISTLNDKIVFLRTKIAGGVVKNKQRTNKSNQSIQLPYRNRPDLTLLLKNQLKKWQWLTLTELINTETNRHTSKYALNNNITLNIIVPRNNVKILYFIIM